MKNRRLVQVMHKCVDGVLAVGRTFKFRSGSGYTVQETGAVVRAEPKPWKNKAERKRYIKARRAIG